MEDTKFFVFDLIHACAPTPQRKYVAIIYIPELDLLCQGIIKRDPHSRDFVVDAAWIERMIDKEPAQNVLQEQDDLESTYIPRLLYLDLEVILYQMIEDGIIAKDGNIVIEEDYTTSETSLTETEQYPEFVKNVSDDELREKKGITYH